jgi:hypothetical protein
MEPKMDNQEIKMRERMWSLGFASEIKEAFDYYSKKGDLRRHSIDSSEARGHFYMALHNLRLMRAIDKFNSQKPQGWEESPDWTITTGYYSMYPAALGLLALRGYTSKNHDATIFTLAHFYTRPVGGKILPRKALDMLWEGKERYLALDDVKKLAEAKGKRSKSSYGHTLSGLEGDAKFFIEQAEPFVKLTLEIAGVEGYAFFKEI